MLYFLICIVVIILLYGPCFYLPNRINEEFEYKYGTNIWSWGYSIANAVTIAILSLTLIKNDQSISYAVAALIAAVTVISGVAIRKCITIAQECNASNTEIAKGILAQILSTFGVALIIIMLFLALVFAESDSKKRKKK